MFQPKQSFAINLSDHSLEALELSRTGSSLSVKSQSRALLPSGVIEDGKIIDPVKLREAVKSLIAQAKPSPIASRDVAITLPESRVFVLPFVLPRSLHEKQVPASLFSQARETMPIDIGLAAADFFEVGRTPDTVRYLFAATYTSLLEEYATFFQSVRLKVTLATMESLAIGAAVIDDKKEETVLVLDIGARTTIASIFKNGELQESINIGIAGNAITASLAEKLKISQAEAEQRKITGGMKTEGDGAEMLIIQGQIQPLKDELIVFIKYYERKNHDTVDRVLLAGGTASLFGLDEYFASNIGLPTALATPLPFFQVSFDRASLPKFLVVLGLARIALGDRRSGINFLSRREKDWLPKKIGGGHVQREAIRAPSSGRRPGAWIFLLCGLAVAAGVLAWMLWQRGALKIPFGSSQKASDATEPEPDLNFILKPFRGTAAVTDRSLTFVVPVSLAEEVPAGYLPGTIESISLDDVVKYDRATVDLIERQLRDQGASLTDDVRLAALQKYLASELWKEKIGPIATEREKQGRFLLPDFLAVSITGVDQVVAPSSDVPVGQMRLRVNFRGMVINDKGAWNAIENQQFDFFTERNPSMRLVSKAYAYNPTDTAVQVIALYTFQPVR